MQVDIQLLIFQFEPDQFSLLINLIQNQNMSSQLSKTIASILAKSNGNTKEAIGQLLSLTNTYPNNKSLMKTILLLMEDQHDWINIKKYINQWNQMELAEGFIKRMRTRLNQTENTKFTNVNDEIDRLSENYWQKLSPKRIITYSNYTKKIEIANQKEKNQKQEKADGDKQSQKSSIQFKKQIQQVSPKKVIQTVSQQVLPRKGILINKLSKGPSLENEKSQSNQLNQNNKKPIENKSSHLAKLLSGVLTKGRATENLSQKVSQKVKQENQPQIAPPKIATKSEEMFVESKKKEQKEERSEYPILKNLESQHKVTISPHKSILDAKANHLRLRKSGANQNEAISASKKNNDFSFSAVREKQHEFNYQSQNKKSTQSFLFSQQKDKSQKKEEKMFIEPIDPTEVSFQKFSGQALENQISPAFKNIRDRTDKLPQKPKQPQSKKNAEKKQVEFANEFILTVSQMKHINLNPEKKGKNIMEQIYKRNHISALGCLKDMLKQMKEERLKKNY